jgi:hypothetical protein
MLVMLLAMMLLLLLLLLLVILSLLLKDLLLSQLLPVVVDLIGCGVVGSISSSIIILSIHASFLLGLHGCNFGRSQKPSSWSTWASHGVFVARLVKVLLSRCCWFLFAQHNKGEKGEKQM